MRKRIEANMRQFFLHFVVKLYIILLITIMRDMRHTRGGLNFERLFTKCHATERARIISVRITDG